MRGSASTNVYLSGECQVYTIGKIGNHTVVSTKLTKMGDIEGDMIAAENSVTRLLGKFLPM